MPKYFNPGNGPVYLENGASIGGGERQEYEASSRLGELVKGGFLVQLPSDVKEESKPKAKAEKVSSKANDEDSQQTESVSE